MFPDRESMHISTRILNEYDVIWGLLRKYYIGAIHYNRKEVNIFRSFFSHLERELPKVTIKGIKFECTTKEIHQKPLVKAIGNKHLRELGDYFVNVKYINNGKYLGSKLVIYQFKVADKNNHTYSIQPEQLHILKDWPTFSFGRKGGIEKTYTLRPKTPDLGSYWLCDTYDYYNNYICSALEVDSIKNKEKVYKEDINNRLICPAQLLYQIAWRYGELVEPNTDLSDFINALSRYLDPSLPNYYDEFDESNIFKEEDENVEYSFIGVDITVKADLSNFGD